MNDEGVSRKRKSAKLGVSSRQILSALDVLSSTTTLTNGTTTPDLSHARSEGEEDKATNATEIQPNLQSSDVYYSNGALEAFHVSLDSLLNLISSELASGLFQEEDWENTTVMPRHIIECCKSLQLFSAEELQMLLNQVEGKKESSEMDSPLEDVSIAKTDAEDTAAKKSSKPTKRKRTTKKKKMVITEAMQQEQERLLAQSRQTLLQQQKPS